MPDLLRGSSGQRLSLNDYWDDFEKNFWTVRDPGFWKLERQQTFQEPDDGSWVAFAAGRWDEAMRLLERQRKAFFGYYQRIAEYGFFTRRVRVVEKPISPYLQWELHVLRLRHEYGGRVRVLGPDQVRAHETSGRLPEIYTLGTDLMYQAVYDQRGILESGIRFSDQPLVVRCQRFIESLYAVGEDLDSFFEREVAGLAPPPEGAMDRARAIERTGERRRQRDAATRQSR